jgi:hypothetical protein
VLCPKSIMIPAWGKDLDKFAPELTYTIAKAGARDKAFMADSNIVIMNHDGMTWLVKHQGYLNGFVQLIVDESTAFKNETQRSKALLKLSPLFRYTTPMSGTPYTNTICDLWRQVFVADQGQRLGNSYFRFRSTVCHPRTLHNGITVWEDKPDIAPVIFELIKDICIRHRLEDCIDIPENRVDDVKFTLSKPHLKIYEEMLDRAVLMLEKGEVTAVNAAVLRNKLLQIASGAVYTTGGFYEILDTDRYELIRDLAEARPQVIISFLWKHQRDLLQRFLPDAKIIDGEVSSKERTERIQQFQNGDIPQLLIHPKAGAHGLTLTAGHATIWASPTYSSEDFTQFNRRIYRAGQTKKTETLLVTAENTVEELVYQKLNGKLEKATDLMSLFK